MVDLREEGPHGVSPLAIAGALVAITLAAILLAYLSGRVTGAERERRKRAEAEADAERDGREAFDAARADFEDRGMLD